MIWQAGGKPFKTDGKNVTINLQDDGSKKWTGDLEPARRAAAWSRSIPGWTDEWFKALGDGTIATLPTGAWMPGVMESSVKAGAGKWAVAPMPTYDGQPATAENGGSTESVLKQSANPALAAGVRALAEPRRGRQAVPASGGFPATTADLKDPAFVDKASAYFGGQKINQVLTGAAGLGRQGLELPAVRAVRQQHLRRHRRQVVPVQVRPEHRPEGLAGRAGCLRQPAGLPGERLVPLPAGSGPPRHPCLTDR